MNHSKAVLHAICHVLEKLSTLFFDHSLADLTAKDLHVSFERVLFGNEWHQIAIGSEPHPYRSGCHPSSHHGLPRAASITSSTTLTSLSSSMKMNAMSRPIMSLCSSQKCGLPFVPVGVCTRSVHRGDLIVNGAVEDCLVASAIIDGRLRAAFPETLARVSSNCDITCEARTRCVCCWISFSSFCSQSRTHHSDWKPFRCLKNLRRRT